MLTGSRGVQSQRLESVVSSNLPLIRVTLIVE